MCVDCPRSRQMKTQVQLSSHASFHKKKAYPGGASQRKRKQPSPLQASHVGCGQIPQSPPTPPTTVPVRTPAPPTKQPQYVGQDSLSNGTNNRHQKDGNTSSELLSVPFSNAAGALSTALDGNNTANLSSSSEGTVTPSVQDRLNSPIWQSLSRTIISCAPSPLNTVCGGTEETRPLSVFIGSPLDPHQEAALTDDAIPSTGPATVPTKAWIDSKRVPNFAHDYALWECTKGGWGVNDCVAKSLKMTANAAHLIPRTEVAIQLQIAGLCQQLTGSQRRQLAGIFNSIVDYVHLPLESSNFDHGRTEPTISTPTATQQNKCGRAKGTALSGLPRKLGWGTNQHTHNNVGEHISDGRQSDPKSTPSGVRPMNHIGKLLLPTTSQHMRNR